IASSGSGGNGQGDDRIRTGDEGFADLCLTTWLRRRSISIARVRGPPEDGGGTKPGQPHSPNPACLALFLTWVAPCSRPNSSVLGRFVRFLKEMRVAMSANSP